MPRILSALTSHELDFMVLGLLAYLYLLRFMHMRCIFKSPQAPKDLPISTI